MGHAMEASVPAAEVMNEDKEGEEGEGVENDRMKISSFTGDLALGQAPVPPRAMPVGLGFWLSCQSIWVARQGLPTSSKARGKAPIVQGALPLQRWTKSWHGGFIRRRLQQRRHCWGGMLLP